MSGVGFCRTLTERIHPGRSSSRRRKIPTAPDRVPNERLPKCAQTGRARVASKTPRGIRGSNAGGTRGATRSHLHSARANRVSSLHVCTSSPRACTKCDCRRGCQSLHTSTSRDARSERNDYTGRHTTQEAPHGGEWARNAKREQEQHRKSRAWRQGQQGCPACCSRQRGWGWKTGKEGTREWRGPRGERVTEERIATSHHIMCGECEAVQEAHNIRAEEEAEGQPIAKLAAAVRDVGPVLAHTGTKGRRKGGTHGGGGNRGGQWRNTRNAR